MKRTDAMDITNRYRGMSDCYIHGEMKDGKGFEALVSGGTEAVLYGLVVIIRRLGIMTNCTFNEVMDDIKLMRQRYEAVGGKGGDLIISEKSKDKDTEEAVKLAEQRTEAKYKNITDNLIAEIETLEATIKNTREDCEKIVKAKDKQIMELSKENLVLDHKIDELIEKVRSMLH